MMRQGLSDPPAAPREILRGRAIRPGHGRGPVLYSPEALGFFGLIDPTTGVITDQRHPLAGRSVAQTILVFPRGIGSTVGSYTLYALSRAGMAPAGMVLDECEAIVASGAVMAGIPTVDRVDTRRLSDWKEAEISLEEVRRV